jgi:DNA replication initiation complex subunit (GINS family)
MKYCFVVLLLLCVSVMGGQKEKSKRATLYERQVESLANKLMVPDPRVVAAKADLIATTEDYKVSLNKLLAVQGNDPEARSKTLKDLAASDHLIADTKKPLSKEAAIKEAREIIASNKIARQKDGHYRIAFVIYGVAIVHVFR